MAFSEDKYFERDEPIVEYLKSLFTPTGRGYGAIIKVVFFVMALGWLADSFLPFIHGFALRIFVGSSADETDFRYALIQLLFVSAIVFVLLLILVANRKRRRIIGKFFAEPSFPHRGLICGLSKYRGRVDIEVLEEQIDEGTIDLEKFYNESNFGLLAFTAAHHAPLLTKCWFCVTDESDEFFPFAEKLVNYVSRIHGKTGVECVRVFVGDGHEIGKVSEEVSKIYRSLARVDSTLKPSDVVSNYSGGTVATSGGIIIATVSKDRKIEYVSQKYFGNFTDALIKNNQETRAIISSETNVEIVDSLN